MERSNLIQLERTPLKLRRRCDSLLPCRAAALARLGTRFLT
jgi:hypothetical protein